MKKLIWALVPSVLLLAGCEDPCKKGVALRNDITTLETAVNLTIVQPSTIDSTCYSVRKSWNKTLTKGSQFASKVATDYFYSEERRCLRDHYERRCDYVSGPYYPGHPHGPAYPGDPYSRPYPPAYACHTIRVCDDAVVIPHKKDGYDQALAAANALTFVRVNLDEACAANAKGDTVGALANFVEAKLKFNDAGTNTDYVLNKAGCFDPNRRGD